VQGVLIVAAKVYAGDLLQGIVRWLFVPRRVGTDFKHPRLAVTNSDDVTDLTDAGVDALSVNRNQRKRSASRQQQRAQASHADPRLPWSTRTTSFQGGFHERGEGVLPKVANIAKAKGLKPVKPNLVVHQGEQEEFLTNVQNIAVDPPLLDRACEADKTACTHCASQLRCAHRLLSRLTYQVSAAPPERTRGRRLLQTVVGQRRSLVATRHLGEQAKRFRPVRNKGVKKIGEVVRVGEELLVQLLKSIIEVKGIEESFATLTRRRQGSHQLESALHDRATAGCADLREGSGRMGYHVRVGMSEVGVEAAIVYLGLQFPNGREDFVRGALGAERDPTKIRTRTLSEANECSVPVQDG